MKIFINTSILGILLLTSNMASAADEICTRFLAIINAEPNAKITNRFAEHGSNQIEIRTYPLSWILTLISGRVLNKSNEFLTMGMLANLTGFVVGEKYDPFDSGDGGFLFRGEPFLLLSSQADNAIDLLLKQYPELAELKDTEIGSEDAEVFYLRQVARFGESLSVIRVLDRFAE